MDFNDRQYYLNRECTWLSFNQRVLRESTSKDTPLLERLRFIAISCSNLDEFFMIRVAGLKHLIESGVKHHDISGLTPQGQMDAVSRIAHEQMHDIDRCLKATLAELKEHGIHFVQPTDLDAKQELWLTEFFEREIFPVVTPMGIDPSHPFPFLTSKSLNLAIHLKRPEDREVRLAILPVPVSVLGRLIKVPELQHYLYLEDILSYFAERFFTGYEILETTPFRITRDADLDIREDVDDLLLEVEKSLEKRRKGAAVRLEIAKSCSKETRKTLQKELELDELDIYTIDGPLGGAFFSSFANLSGYDALRYEPFVPQPSVELAARKTKDIWKAIREKDVLVHHPYETFATVENFIRTAADDDAVLAIKQTLYRVSGNSPIIASLIKAAENGKQVTVLVELKARFDEENNINWAKKLEKAGCHVIYGLTGLKTHCKIALVVRREEDGIRRYLHLGTGNYNDSTAKIYTDLGLFTCNEQFGADASSLFNVITGYSRPPEYKHFIVAPHGMRSFFEYMIRQETENAKKGLPSGITVKVNSLVDPKIIELLYEASKAGVRVQLIVRGICCLIPGIEGVSENITVMSIVGQLLEHSRIFRFENAGNPRIYMGSADWMPRNLDRRVELVFPIEDETQKARAFGILDTMLSDTTNARFMQSDTSYEHVDLRGKKKISSQLTFYHEAQARLKELQSIEKDSVLIPIHSAEE